MGKFEEDLGQSLGFDVEAFWDVVTDLVESKDDPDSDATNQR